MLCAYVQVSAAIASRSGVNVYNMVMAMERWLALNPTCYLGVCQLLVCVCDV
jgi:cell fate regulator YaaT (PSP1 superfamily)